MALGVRETFEVGDYARVLFNIATDTKGRVLTPEQLIFCLSVLHVLADALPASGGSSSNAVLHFHPEIQCLSYHTLYTFGGSTME